MGCKQPTTRSQVSLVSLLRSVCRESGCLYSVHDGMELIIAEIRQTSAGTSSHWASLSPNHWVKQSGNMSSLLELGFLPLWFTLIKNTSPLPPEPYIMYTPHTVCSLTCALFLYVVVLYRWPYVLYYSVCVVICMVTCMCILALHKQLHFEHIYRDTPSEFTETLLSSGLNLIWWLQPCRTTELLHQAAVCPSKLIHRKSQYLFPHSLHSNIYSVNTFLLPFKLYLFHPFMPFSSTIDNNEITHQYTS